MKKSILIVGFYPKQSKLNQLNFSPASISKIEYLMEVLSKRYYVDMLSCSWKTKNIIEYNIGNKGINFRSIFYLKSFFHNGLFKFINLFFLHFQLFFFIIFNFKNYKKIIFYHSPFILLEVFFASLLFPKKIILEVEEIYSSLSKSLIRKAVEYFIFFFPKYFLFSTELLLNLPILKKKTHYIFFYGSLTTSNFLITNSFRSNNKIKLVYIGTTDLIKAGAQNALKLASLLDSKFEIHMLVFGEKRDMENLKRNAKLSNNKYSCKVLIREPIFGNDLKSFLLNCDFGLSLQNTDHSFNLTSFPSKVLVYLSSNLRVVSFPAPALLKSEISDLILFSKKSELKEISSLIVDNCFKENNIRNKFNLYKENFEKKLLDFITIK
jgi:hypothetical protein